MAKSPDNPGDADRRKGSLPSGVRGPGGPPPPPVRGSEQSGGRSAPPARPASGGGRRSLEEASYPVLRRLHAMPRWIIVITPAILLFVGLILPASLAWLGGILLLIVCLFLVWLTALSWPAIGVGSRILRVIVVVALFGVAIAKLLGRF